MSKHRTISFRVDKTKVEALDSLAESVERDRTYLLNEAVTNYLELQQYQIGLIKEGLKAVKDGRTMEASDVRARITKLAHSRRAKS